MNPDRTAPGLRISDASEARVLRAIRFGGAVSRPEIAARTGLSAATVGRTITALIKSGAVRERADLMHSGSVGRPSVPVEIDPLGPVVVAVHIGLHRCVVAVCDLNCRILSEQAVPTPGRDPETVLDELSALAFQLLDRHRGRHLARGGVASALRRVAGGHVDHDLLGWRSVPVTDLFSDRLGVPFTAAPHVEAMAAAELLVGHETHEGTTLVVYGRESIGSALVIDGAVHQPTAGPSDLTCLPVGPTTVLDDRGHGVLDVISDTGLLRAAAARDIDVDSVNALAALSGQVPDAERILVERAEVLGRLTGLVAAVTRPDSVVLVGQAFTDHPRYLRHVLRASREVPLAGRRPELRVSTAGGRIQQLAAMAVALDALSANPVTALGDGPSSAAA